MASLSHHLVLSVVELRLLRGALENLLDNLRDERMAPGLDNEEIDELNSSITVGEQLLTVLTS